MDIDWGDQLIRVYRKGTGEPQGLPTSSDSLVWLRLYLNDLSDALRPNEPCGGPCAATTAAVVFAANP